MTTCWHLYVHRDVGSERTAANGASSEAGDVGSSLDCASDAREVVGAGDIMTVRARLTGGGIVNATMISVT